MKHIVEKVSVVLIVLSLMIVPVSTVKAAELTYTERAALVEQITNQIISLLEARIAELTIQLNELLAKKQDIPTNTPPVFGSVQSMNYSISVSTEFGKGSWKDRDDACKVDDKSDACLATFLDGKVRFTVTPTPKHVQLTYSPANNPSDEVTTGGLFHDGVGEAGYFHPNTKYNWKIEATNDAGEKAVATGEFTTGDY